MTEYERFVARERRKDRIARLVGCALMLGSALLVAGLIWLFFVVMFAGGA